MAEYEFKLPDFLQGNSVDEIMERMMAELPEDLDNTPGGFPYDFTKAVALAEDEVINFFLVRVLMTMFPQFAWDEWLDLHGQIARTRRKEASYGTGYLELTGSDGVEIKTGTIFCTPATNESAAIEFETTKDSVIQDGKATIPIKALEAGKESNVAAGTITLALKPIQGVQTIINPAPITGGTEIESDDSFRERIMDINATIDTSSVGNMGDYRRWAMEVAGVGHVDVIDTWDGAGTVKLIITDAEGNPANEDILEKVYHHLMSPDEPYNRKVPAGGPIITITAPLTIKINYKVVVTLIDGAQVEDVANHFKKDLKEYYSIAKQEGILKYSKVYAVLINTLGVNDIVDLLINGEKSNISISRESFPVTETVIVEIG